MLSDYHIHSHFSSDSEEKLENIANTALSLGMSSICLTDHMDYDYPISPDEPDMTFFLDIPEYAKALGALRMQYAGRLDIRTGIELGIQPHIADENYKISKSHPFDFIIASTHIVGKKEPFYPSFWDGQNIDDCLAEYFSDMLDSLKKFDNYDVCGHLDYIIRYIPDKSFAFSYKDYSDIIDEILCEIISKDKGIEINTAGYRYSLNSPNPCTDIIKRYKELGGKIITVGSDAHFAKDVGSGFDKARNVLLACGFDSYYTFKERTPYRHSL